MTKHSISEFDLFFISYDEPQKEEFWARLQDAAPWAQRVDGVKGFDRAHKECARLSATDRFITVDGDNIVHPEFFNLSLTIPDELSDCTLSWAGKNIINGLCYGNGGLKLWTRDFVMSMRSHEASEAGAAALDFCWDKKYVQLNGVYSTTCPNGSPFQAFRAGFREGTKMSLDCGNRVQNNELTRVLHEKNLKRLLIWASIGSDIENGLWAIYGARLGIWMTNIESGFDLSQISDYDWFKSYFNSEIAPQFEGHGLQRCSRTGMRWDAALLQQEATRLRVGIAKTCGLTLADMDAAQSTFFKEVWEPPRRTANALVTEIEADRL